MIEVAKLMEKTVAILGMSDENWISRLKIWMGSRKSESTRDRARDFCALLSQNYYPKSKFISQFIKLILWLVYCYNLIGGILKKE